jgi:hypothetical protein
MQGYLQDLRIYKGLAKYKGGFDVPKPYTPVGIESWRTTADTCKNNFATLNPLYRHVSSNTYTNGNLKAVALANNQTTTGNMAFSSGKWYWETRIFNDEMIGLAIPSRYIGGYPGQNTNGFSYHQGGSVYYSGTTNYGSGWPGSTYRIIGLAVDWTNRRAYWSVDGVWANSADPSAGTGFYDITVNASQVAASVDALPAWRSRSTNASEQVSVNFGQNPSLGGELSNAGTFTDDSGKGLFKYAPPTGFLALCEDNLPAPAIADPGEHFKIVLYANQQKVSGVGFKPDLIWTKSRNQLYPPYLYDSVRGVGGIGLNSNVTDPEGTNDTDGILSFDDDGFTWSTDAGLSQTQGVAWCWKAGGAAVSNTDGTITSQISANQTAGFSIVSYTGNNTDGASIGHGLGKKPTLIIVKERNGASGWFVFQRDFGPAGFLQLHDSPSVTTDAGAGSPWFGTEPTDQVFTVGANGATNDNTRPIIAYCWAEIENYSRIGIYYGNDSDDGSFIYCGFKPAFVMTKRFDSGGSSNWLIHDSTRDPVNPVMGTIWGNLNNIEGRSNVIIDMLSNGFKHRNGDGGTGNNRAIPAEYIFMAFAESPFQTANAK